MSKNAPERVQIPELQEKLESRNKPLVVDVRKTSEIQESGAIPGALHLPIEEVDTHIKEFPEDKEIVFYCGGGGRASRAAQTLWDAGFRNVQYFGLRDWRRRGLPVSKTVKRFGKA